MNPGDLLSHYRVIGLLGAGGMGEVYKAEDTRLKRLVALKVLTPALSEHADAKERLMVEAQAASALDHPNICTIYEIDSTAEGGVFLSMAYYDGETLSKRLASGQVPIDEAIEIFTQLTRGVAAAHEAGVIHRDIKPANILLTARPANDPSRVKLLDFGIAKVSDRTSLTRTGTTIGTMAYMAPEHAAGHAIDQRADIWSLGVVLYEMIAGRRPFDAPNPMAIMKSIADDEPAPLGTLRAGVPPALEAIVQRALQKRARDRYASAREVLADIDGLRPSTMTATITMPLARAPRRTTPAWILGGSAALIALAAGGWLFTQRVRANEITQTVSEIRSMVEAEKYSAAFRRIHTLTPDVAADPAIAKAARDYLLPMQIQTDPPGATLEVKGYDEPDQAWIALGNAPVNTRGWVGPYRWRISKDGYETFEGSGPPLATGEVTFKLNPVGTSPAGMVFVPAVTMAGVQLPGFFIDRYEITNKAFKRFVDAGGYRNASYWPTTFEKDGRTLGFDQAMAEFRDATGRPGPSAWELGSYPEGQDDFPVGGISWYEAAAFAKFAGKSLPTVYHWRAAALQSVHSQVITFSNFNGKGPVGVGTLPSLGAYGTYDMAGNVKEWCENEVDGKRYILGGGWNEPNYQYSSGDAREPFDRATNLGLRLMHTPDPVAVPASAHHSVARLFRDYSTEKPVSDEMFSAFRRLYDYDAADLAAKTESIEENETWRVERVSYTAGYGNARIPAYLFLPKNAKPPYETVLYFPHSGGLVIDSFQQAEMSYLGFLVKSGRALLFPMYQGTYERRQRTPATGTNAVRDLIVQQVKDARRSVDYLSSRADIASDKIAYFGVSMGATRAPIVLAVEPRFKTAILWSGGLPTGRTAPEIDAINFAPRVTTPLLMLNGRDDFTFPPQASQEPLYRLLGTPAEHRRRGLYDGGHVFPFSRMIKDSLDWLDKYLGVPN